MPKLTRFFTLLLLVVSAIFILVGSSVYFFDVNDYSQWLSEQLKQSTGYDIRFEQLENNWVTDDHLAFINVSLYHQQTRVLLIKRVDIQIAHIDLWQQQLQISDITFTGGEWLSALPQNSAQNPLIQNEPNHNALATQEALSWQTLTIDKVSFIDFNASLNHGGRHISVQGAKAQLKDLSIIEHQQLVMIPVSVDVNAQVTSLLIADSKKSVQLDGIQVSAQGNLRQQTSKLVIGVDEIAVVPQSLPKMAFSDFSLALQQAQTQFSLDNLSLNAFDGYLVIQGEATTDIRLFPTPRISINEVLLSSVLLKEMWLTLPSIAPFTAADTKPTSALPIEALSIQHLQLENIHLNSDNEAFPLLLTDANLAVSDLTLIQQHQWLSLEQYEQQSTPFSVAFDYLQWQDTIIEAFSATGYVNKVDQNMLLLEEIVR